MSTRGRASPFGIELPRCLESAAREEGRDDWLSSIGGTVAEFSAAWSLTVGRPFQPGGQTAWVAPARGADGAELVLKIAWRHPEAEHEGDGLRVWAGNGAVLLHEAAQLDDTTVLLIERCTPGTALSEYPEPFQDTVIASVLRRLWVAAPQGQRFPPLADMCNQWAEQFETKCDAGHVALDAGLAAEGMTLFRSLATSADQPVLLCTDLHAGNVLAAQRTPWLVVDPKPHVGDRTYDVLQHMLNCPQRLHEDPLGLVDTLTELLELDRERLRLWLFARCVQESADWPRVGDIARRLAPR